MSFQGGLVVVPPAPVVSVPAPFNACCQFVWFLFSTNVALKFLVHFFGDLHQPLHTAGRARGENEIKDMFDGRPTGTYPGQSRWWFLDG